MRTTAVLVGLALGIAGLGLTGGCAMLGWSDSGIEENWDDVVEVKRLTETWLTAGPYLDLDQVGDLDVTMLDRDADAPESEDAPQFVPDAVPVASHLIGDIRVLLADDGHEAIAQCREETRYLVEGKPVVQTTEITAIYARTPSGWKLVHVSRMNPERQ